MKHRVLVIEDEREIAELMRLHLVDINCRAKLAFDGATGLAGALLWQHLVREKQLPPDGRLPPVLPVVVYNGDPRWAMPLALHELVGLPDDTPLWRYQPDMRYHIVDEGAFSDDDLAARDTLAALLFRLEASPDPDRVVALADAVLAWFGRHPGFDGLRPLFAALLGGLMGPLAPGIRVPEELLEVRNMLATRAEDWKRQ
jgi:hypothetical protein